MASDFFERQDAARRNTTRLVLLFVAAVVGMIVSIDLLLAVVLGFAEREPGTGAIDWARAADPRLLLLATVGTLAVVGAGSLYKVAQLRGGGPVVAESLGGRRLHPDTGDPAERQLLNVVDEMAIASGISAPPVYLMEQEPAINAFAAGFTPADAVIGVTRGTMERLSRDELQGVIAHEFSHILNGDMRLNIRLIGLLHGILVVGILGYFMLRSAAFAGHRQRSRDSNPMPLLAIGLGLMVIGFVGTFFGNLIKAAVSRQREFLADASAVQFTRQPSGIAGALMKIGGSEAGAKIRNPNAPEASHMFFGRATSGLSALFSTHPPLPERIRRIDPSWDGSFPESSAAAPPPSDAAVPGGVSSLAGASGRSVPTAESIMAQVGRPGGEHLAYAARLLAGLPPRVLRAAHEPYGSRALMYALLLDRDPAIRRRQLDHLSRAADPGVFKEVGALTPELDGLERPVRLPLVELALPALRELTAEQYDVFRSNMQVLVEADQAIDLFEWSLRRVLLHDLDVHFGRQKPAEVRHRALEPLLPQVQVLLSLLAAAGHRNEEGRTEAFEAGRRALDAPLERLSGAGAATLSALDQALAILEAASPAVKRRVVAAGAACVTADARITTSEAELLRALAASLGCPMPPLLS